MRALVLLVLVGVAVAANAAIYRWVDADGTVTYSDRPQPGSEQLKLTPLQTFSPPPVPNDTASVPKQTRQFKDYEEFAILAPRNGATFRNNGGNIDVQLELEPALRSTHRVDIILNGLSLGDTGRTMSLTLNNVDRGTHRLQAMIMDESGNELARTDTVTFYLHRTTAFHN